MLRDKFAMAAMQGFLSNHNGYFLDDSKLAKEAYGVAEAMIKERAKHDFSNDPDNIDQYIKDGYGYQEQKPIPPDAKRPPIVDENTGKPIDQTFQPDWSQAPETAVEWLMAEDGRFKWVLFEHGETWYTKAPSFNYQGDWRDSLRKRPKNPF